MILFKWGELHEKEPDNISTGLRAWRWVLDIGFFSIGVYQQVIFKNDKPPKWRHSTQYIDINIAKHFALGQWHGYYDGPHCCFSIGFLHINWSWNWCKKCMPDEDSPCHDGKCNHSYHQ